MNNLKQVNDLAWKHLGEQIVIVELGAKRFFHELDPVAGHIWKLCDGSHSKEQIVKSVYETFDAPIEQIGQDVEEFLQELVNKELLEEMPLS